MKRASGGVISGEKLSSGFDNLKQHKKRVNYQAVSSPVWLLKEIQSQNLFLLRHRLAMSRWLSHSRVWKYMQEDFQNRALREKCPNKEFFLCPYFPTFRLNMDQNKTTNLDTFHAVEAWMHLTKEMMFNSFLLLKRKTQRQF